jgi:DNA-binding MarR family transcriptional regulator
LPFDTALRIRDECFCLHVQRAARAVGRRYDEALRPYGLTNGQFSLLMSLNRPEPATMGPVAKLLAMDRTTLTAALKPLERRALVEVAADPKDRRSRHLILTETGRALLAQAVPAWRATQNDIEALLAAAEAESFRGELRALS